MKDSSRSDARHWRSRPAWSILIRAVAFAVPLLASVVVGAVVGRLLPPPNTSLELVGWWSAVLASSTVAVIGTDRWARKLLPLATLMRLSMIFPDRAPSRLKVARRFAGSRAIAAELDQAHRSGVTGDRQAAAETILALVGALGEYDSRTRGHSERTQLFVTMLAQELKLRDEDRGRLMWAALVHDIGKLKVPHEVLNKPSAPTDEEWAILHSHPVQGAVICEPLREWLGDWWLAIEQHHERYEGTGYPRGLAGHEISYGARIVSVADSYEVMTAARPYKVPMTAAAARAELTRCAGQQFDPDIVRAFLNISIGRSRTFAGPLAWLAQIALVRPGPLLGNVLGTASGAVAAAAGVFALSLVPNVADAATARTDRPGSVVDAAGPGGSPSGLGDPSAPNGPATTSTGGTGTPTGSDPRVTEPGASGATPSQSGGSSSPGEPGSPESTGQTPGSTPKAPTQPPSGGPTPQGPGTPTTPTTPGTPGTSTRPGTPTQPPGSTSPPPTPNPVVPLSARPDAYTVVEDVSETWDVTANDVAGDHGPLRLVAVSGASRGAASVTADGKVRYDPSPNANGSDSVTYTVRDQAGASDTATVSITITAVNDPPTTRPDAYVGKVGVLLTVGAASGVLANDDDVDGDTLTVTGDNSALVDIRSDGSIRFLPVLPGRTTVTYTVSDGTTSRTGTATFTITLLKAAPPLLFRAPLYVSAELAAAL